MVASCCDLGVFVCGIILITKTSWTAAERRSMGLAMLVMQVRWRPGQPPLPLPWPLVCARRKVPACAACAPATAAEGACEACAARAGQNWAWSIFFVCHTPFTRATLVRPCLQATGFLIFISVRVLLAGRTILLTVAPMLRGLVRRGHSAPSSS